MIKPILTVCSLIVGGLVTTLAANSMIMIDCFGRPFDAPMTHTCRFCERGHAQEIGPYEFHCQACSRHYKARIENGMMHIIKE